MLRSPITDGEYVLVFFVFFYSLSSLLSKPSLQPLAALSMLPDVALPPYKDLEADLVGGWD
jgi:hypothetical protein